MNKDIMRKMGFSREIELNELGCCPICGRPIDMDDFRDTLSIKEFNISGMCQHCQDEMFGGSSDDEE